MNCTFLQYIKKVKKDPKYHQLHCNMSAKTVAFEKESFSEDPFFQRTLPDYSQFSGQFDGGGKGVLIFRRTKVVTFHHCK